MSVVIKTIKKTIRFSFEWMVIAVAEGLDCQWNNFVALYGSPSLVFTPAP